MVLHCHARILGPVTSHECLCRQLQGKPVVPDPSSMSSQTTLHRTISFTADAKLAPPPGNSAMSSTTKTGRRRRSSSIIYQEPPETVEQISDQAVNPNLNSQWVNAKGGRFSRCRATQKLTARRCLDHSPGPYPWT